MTTLATDEAERLALIHETGYWRVLIHPTLFEEHRIPTLSACWDLVENATVALRGWNYPHTDRNERKLGSDWIQSGSTFANHIELWRLYQSGQFVHQFALWEDREPPSFERWSGEVSPVLTGSNRLDFVDALFTVTEVLAFARGLAYRGVLEPSALLRIELHGMQDRLLASPPDRTPLLRRVSSLDTICWEQELPSAQLVAMAPQVALDASIHIFERFGWDKPPRRMLEENQRRLLERRL